MTGMFSARLISFATRQIFSNPEFLSLMIPTKRRYWARIWKLKCMQNNCSARKCNANATTDGCFHGNQQLTRLPENILSTDPHKKVDIQITWSKHLSPISYCDYNIKERSNDCGVSVGSKKKRRNIESPIFISSWLASKCKCAEAKFRKKAHRRTGTYCVTTPH